MLLKRDQSCLLLVDVQEKLTPHVMNSAALIERCRWLCDLAVELDIPTLVSEQYPKGLGHTVPELRSLGVQHPVMEKEHFSCWGDLKIREQINSLNKQQILVIGIEAHVCVLQTALELHEANYQVFVVVDAVSSRNELDCRYALKRMKQAGIILVTTEMVFFEWIQKAGTESFKTLSKQFIQKG